MGGRDLLVSSAGSSHISIRVQHHLLGVWVEEEEEEEEVS